MHSHSTPMRPGTRTVIPSHSIFNARFHRSLPLPVPYYSTHTVDKYRTQSGSDGTSDAFTLNSNIATHTGTHPLILNFQCAIPPVATASGSVLFDPRSRRIQNPEREAPDE